MKQGEERAGKGTVFRDGPVARENLAEEVTLETQTSEGGALSLPGAGGRFCAEESWPSLPGCIHTFVPFQSYFRGWLISSPRDHLLHTSAILILGV